MTPNKPEPLTTPRSCAFCNWNGDVGAFAHATLIHPDKDWAVVPQMGHEFVIDMTLVRDAARTPSQPDLREARAVIDAERDRAHAAGEHEYERGLEFAHNPIVAARASQPAPADPSGRRMPIYPMAQCLDGRHPPFNLETHPNGCPIHLADAALAAQPAPAAPEPKPGDEDYEAWVDAARRAGAAWPAPATPSQPDRPVDSYPFAEVCPGCGRSDEHAAPCTVRVRLPGHATPSQPDLREARAVIDDLTEKPCGVIWGNYPKGTTCLDLQRLAADPATRFGEEYRESHLRGDRLCFRCKVRAALASQPAPAAVREPEEPERYVVTEKLLRDAWLRMDAVGGPRTAHVLWEHIGNAALSQPAPADLAAARLRDLQTYISREADRE